MYFDIKEGDMRGRDSPSKLEAMAAVKALKEKEKEVIIIDPYQEDMI
jgi:hypothetical protein